MSEEGFEEDLPKNLNEWMKSTIEKEPKGGARAQFIKEFGGVDTVVKLLNVNEEEGLSDDPIDRKVRLTTFGTNTLPETKSKWWVQLFIGAFGDTTILILCAAAIISLILGSVFPERDPETGVEDKTGWVEGLSIVVAVLLVTIITSTLDWDKARQFKKLNKADVLKAKVRRNGEPMEIDAVELVTGDIIILAEGDRVPCDGFLLRQNELHIDESSMTGENLPVSKSVDKDPLLLSNTMVLQGSGIMIATALGVNSMWGQTLKDLQDHEADDTPLQEYLDDMAEFIGKVGLTVGFICFFILAIYWAIDTSEIILKETWSPGLVRGLVDAFIIGITVLVVAIPEGLPLAVTISLAYSMRAMLKDQNLVRHLEACETMGGATNICSDKTGTLTQNVMTVVKGFIGYEAFTEEKKKGGNDGKIVEMELNVPFKIEKKVQEEFILNNIYLNSKTIRQRKEQKLEEEEGCCSKKQQLKLAERWDVVGGNPTEMSLVDMADRLSEKQLYHKEVRHREKVNIIKEFPFSSVVKRMYTIVYRKEENVCRLFCKGAPDQLIKDLSNLLHPDGKMTQATSGAKEKLEKMVQELSSDGLRTLLIAYRDFPANEWLNPAKNENDPVSERFIIPDIPTLPTELTYVGLFGIEDPVRPEVPGAVEKCMKAGIVVRMVTGDYEVTAKKIAQKCSIVTSENDIVWSGEVFRKKSDKQVKEALPRLKVLARSLPDDKLRLVKLLKEEDEVVAVTGDGTNDAKALKEADVGLSMGSGSNVAKEASDIVIMDDNFNSIVKSVLWGRCVFENIRKFLQFQLTVNFGALVISLIGAVSKRGPPLRAVQLLWVNLIMDTMAALALGTEQPQERLMDDKPHGRDEKLLTNRMIKHIGIQAIYQVIVLMVILYAGDKIWNVERKSLHHYTIIFNSFVFCQVFNEINCRTVIDQMNIFKGFFTNWVFLGVIVITVILQFLIIEFTSSVFKVHGLNFVQWISCIGIGAFCLILGFIARMIPVPEKHFMEIFTFWKTTKNKHEKLKDKEQEREFIESMHMKEIDLENRD
eukprot:TRINITY_DN967_c0_g1_i3.p1 TRINITY_DN967_c0_g1~~TRINITY_DN967_c0_g1_i3.p1  ORF type:complete len:1042 (-),score=346.69 TRINITY_DN967_c0_g1_i3:10-3135(-)